MQSGENEDRQRKSIHSAAGRAVDAVRLDGILKETVTMQEKARDTWHDRWGFMLELSHGKERKIKDVETAIPSANWPPPSPSMPATTSGFVGWRSGLSLEAVGPLYTSPLSSLEPAHLPQITIFIG